MSGPETSDGARVKPKAAPSPADPGRRLALIGLGTLAVVGVGAFALRGGDLFRLGAGGRSGAGAATARTLTPGTDGVLALGWDDLRPAAEKSLLDEIAEAGQLGESPLANGALDGGLLGVVPHGAVTEDMAVGGTEQVAALDGARVSLPGYTVPLTFGPEGSDNFLLVPYVGACIHVPPPPPNQIVHVTTEQPVMFAGLFDAVTVTGAMALISEDLDLAQVGYRIMADDVSPYDDGWTSSSDATLF